MKHVIRENIIFYTCAATILLLGSAFVLSTQLHTDVLYLMSIMKTVFSSNQELYIDIIDINTPLAYYFNVPAILLSGLFQISTASAFKIVTILVIVILSILYYHLLGKFLFGRKQKHTFLFFLLLLLFAGWDFGQREHLLTILLWPLILSRLIFLSDHSPPDNRIQILIGLMAGIGVMFKPHFVLILIGMEVFVIIATQSMKPLFNYGNLGVLTGISGYVLFIILFLPRFFELFLIGFKVYPHFISPDSVFFRTESLIVVFLFLVAGIFWKRLRNEKPLLFILTITIASWFGGVFQNKGWTHHFFPFRFSGCICIIFLLDRISLRAAQKKWVHLKAYGFHILGIMAVIWLICLPLLNGLVPPLSLSSPLYKDLVSITKRHAGGKSIASLSTELYPLLLLEEEAETKWTTHYRNFWILPGLYKDTDPLTSPYPYHALSEMDSIEREFFQSVLSDLIHRPPSLLFVHTEPLKNGFGNTTFDFLEYFSQDHRFLTLFSLYEPIGNRFSYSIYRLRE